MSGRWATAAEVETGEGRPIGSFRHGSLAKLLVNTGTSRVLAPHERALHTFEQSRPVERLGQKADCPGSDRAFSDPIIEEGSDENRRHAVPARNQVLLQLDAAHTGHLNIRDEAGRVGQARRKQEFFGRRKCVS